MADEQSEEWRLIEHLNRGFASIAGWCFDHRWIVAALCVGLFAGGGYLASGIGIDGSYEAYFHEGDRTFLAYEEYREDFGSDEVAYVGFELPGLEYGPFNLEAMRKLAQLTQALQDEVPFVYDVTTLANAELTVGSEDGIEVTRLIDSMPETQEELLILREAYLRKPMLVGGIINEEANFGGIIIEMDLSSTDPPDVIRWDPEKGDELENLYPQVSDTKIVEILGRPEYSDFEFFVSGDVPLNAYYNRIIMTEPAFQMLIALGLISLILVIAFRSFVAVITPAIVMLLSIVMTMALMAALDWKIGLTFSRTPTLLMAIGVAHSVHILSEFRTRFALLGDRREALVQTIHLVGTPCLLTSLTTATGFASMSFVPIKSIAHSAVYTAFGVMAAFVLSFTLLMALLSFGSRTQRVEQAAEPAREAAQDQAMRRFLAWAAQYNIDHRGRLIAAFAAFMVLCGAGATQISVDSNWLNDFWPDAAIRADTVRVDDEMGGTTNIIYLFDGGEADAIKEPAVLREIDRLQTRAAQEDWLVRKTYSIVDIVKDLNQTFHGDDPAYHRIPETREMVAQYLLLYETSGGEEAEEYVSSDYQRANLELRLRIAPTNETADLVEDLDGVLAKNPLEASTLSLTGIGALWLKLMDYIVSSQVQGFSIAITVITLMMIGIFRSLKIGLISMVPNLAPVLLALGAMGWMGISLDYNKLTIAAIAIGISVDDTIHLMTRFHHEFGLHGNYRKALHNAMGDVGRALLITSAALVLGFLIFITSELRSQAQYGLLLSGSIVTALFADFFFMPALVLAFKPFGPEGQGRGAKNQAAWQGREAA